MRGGLLMSTPTNEELAERIADAIRARAKEQR